MSRINPVARKFDEGRLATVLVAPIISEKATRIAEKQNQVLFKVLRDATKPEIKAAVEAHARDAIGLPAVFVEQAVQDGTAGAVALARPYVDGPVLIVFVDTIFDADLSVIRTSDADGIIWTKEVEDYQRFGVVVTDADVAWFEYVAFLSADGELPARSGELHPPGSQRQPGMTLLVAEIDGEGVGTALSVATGRVNNIGAVAVMPAHRGRGIAAALTEAAIAVADSVPATLSATPAGRGVYQRLGFTEVGRPVHHHPAD